MIKLVLTFCPDGLTSDWDQLGTEFQGEEAEVTFIRVISCAGIFLCTVLEFTLQGCVVGEPQTKAIAQYDEYSYTDLDWVLWKTEKRTTN